ncbi:WD40 repeat domain-containing protein [Naegleria gruberi]|uniref:WD40 repeat domain-containing protein n=1 Tax=Naegleria gruberi TaxID=5762 RepID=D2V0M7_NAEGR|nr:WD40 repeat domain-containing protein [Naegleria gruberi]EFC49547.1 WD40 repeat domain-containing protein [Naegleria gruberi]|eukprot:XP_002682291.1 WD40 repeat domain-containing protein [Naegleria gruberi strain NEG-M]
MSWSDMGLPLSFGGKRTQSGTAKKSNNSSSETKSLITISNTNDLNGKAISKNLKSNQEEKKPMVVSQVRHFEDLEEDTSDNDDFSSGNDFEKIPLSQTAKMKGHRKAVTAIAIDTSGSRLISGSSDYTLKFWDFQGMDESLQSYKEIDEITESASYAIKHLSFSNSGDKFILSDNSLQAILYDRDGGQLGKFKKGDTYIVDMTKTNGHTASWTGVQWNPDQSNRHVISSSMDTTVRVWDMETFTTKQITVFKARNSKGLKTPVTSCCYSNDGKLITAGCLDGSIQIWKNNGNPNKCDMSFREKDERGSRITSIVFHNDDQTLVTRDEDNLKIFDIRNFNSPISVLDNLPNLLENSNCVFSPLNDIVVTVVSSISPQDKGSIVFYDWKNDKVVDTVHMNDGISPVQVRWHPIINQIFVAGTDSSITGFYDKEVSLRGLVTSTSKTFKKKNIDQAEMVQPQIIAPYALSQNKEPKKKGRKDPVSSQKPKDPPPKGPGFGGRINDSFTHFLMKGMGAINQFNEHENARDAILKHAAEAEKNPLFISPAYSKTQPNAIFDYGEDDESEEDQEQPQDENDPESRFKKRKLD